MTAVLQRCRPREVGVALLVVGAALAVDCTTPTVTTATDSRGLAAYVERSADSLDAALATLSHAASDAVRGDSASVRRVRIEYRHSRTQYKKLEGIVEFYAPALAAALNSRRQEVDDDDAPPPSSAAPGGFPAVEVALFTATPIDAAKLDTIVRGMRHVVRQLHDIGAALAPSDAQFLELNRLELARISTLSIAGFDTPLTHDALRESADALDGLRALVAAVGATHRPGLAAERAGLDSALAAAARYLLSHPDFEDFDRLEFIVRYATPAAHALDAMRRASGTAAVAMKRGWRADIPSVYDSGAFDPRAYAADNAPAPSAALIALGRKLFSDPVLSGNGTRSCASCHQSAHAFTDGLARAARIDGRGVVARHTPTLINAALAPAQFADERSITLEEQVKRVVESRTEMNGSLDRAAARIGAQPDYAALFRASFASSRADVRDSRGTVTGSNIRFAVAAYVRSLIGMNSRFDRAVRGDTEQLSSAERRGFNLFMGKAGCGTCHFAPLFNGNTPPLYLSADVEVIGVPGSSRTPSITDSDSGRAAVDRLPLHVGAFKTPTVRNATHTAPYMHNGVYRSLDAVLRFYSAGGGVGAGARIPNQTLPADRVELSVSERKAIVAFLGALTDTSSYKTR